MADASGSLRHPAIRTSPFFQDLRVCISTDDSNAHVLGEFGKVSELNEYITHHHEILFSLEILLIFRYTPVFWQEFRPTNNLRLEQRLD